MLSFATLTTFAALALGPIAQAVSVTAPLAGDDWLSGTTNQLIAWLPVKIDQTSFTVVLSNQAGFLGPTSTQTILIANQSTGSADILQSTTVTYPSGAWPTGHSFRINLQSSPTDGNILAQSGEFNITYSALTSTTSSSSAVIAVIPSTLSTATGASTTAPITLTSDVAAASGVAGGASGGIIPSVTAKSGAGSVVGHPSTVVASLLGVAGLIKMLF